MSKSSRSNAHRRVDVDQFDEDRFVLEQSATDMSGALTERQSQLRSLLNSGQNQQALVAAIQEPFYGADQKTKDEYVRSVVEVFCAFRSNEIAKAAGSLEKKEVDTCLKYVFRGMGFPDIAGTSSATLLAWHKACVDAAGEGSIIRVLSDRRQCV